MPERDARASELQRTVAFVRELDQGIVYEDDAGGYVLTSVAAEPGRVPSECRESEGVRSDDPARAALNELRCAWFRTVLVDRPGWLAEAGVHDEPVPTSWDTQSWEGAAAWNTRLAGVTPARRCRILRQALVFAIAKANTVKPTWSIERRATDAHALFVADPEPGHVEDRRTAAWPLRYLRFTDPAWVPDGCTSVKIEGDLRFVEATATWDVAYPGVFGPSPPGEFGRQALGNAYGMCGRSNNAHWVDRIEFLVAFNATRDDPAAILPVGADNEALARDLLGGDADRRARYRAAWEGDLDWDRLVAGTDP